MNFLRPDERALEAERERSKSSDAILKKGAKTALGIASGAVGLGLGSRLMPFLNELVPTDLALKGISKIAPKVGNFLKKGQSMGLDVKEGLNFIKDNISKNTQKLPEQQNIIAQYDDQLHSFLENLIKSGRSPLEAGALARSSGKFDKAIKKMEKDHKANWSQILESVYGLGERAQPQSQQAPQMQQQPTQIPAQAQPQNNNDQMLIAALEKILQM